MVKDLSDSESGNLLCHHLNLSFRLTARILLYVPSHRQDRTYHSRCYTGWGALAGTRNRSVGTTNEMFSSILMNVKDVILLDYCRNSSELNFMKLNMCY